MLGMGTNFRRDCHQVQQEFSPPPFLLTPSFPVLANMGKDGSLPVNVLNLVPWAGNNTGACQPP